MAAPVVESGVIDLESGWSEVMRELNNLEAIVDDLRHKRSARDCIDNKRYMTVFVVIYNMVTQTCAHNFSEQIYQRLREYVKSYVARTVEPSLRQAVKNGDYIAALDANWKVYYVFVKWVRSFFSYLDRFHTKRQGLPSVSEVIVRPFQAAAISAVLSQVTYENLALTRCFAHATEIYMRSKYPSAKIDPASNIKSTVCEYATLPLNTPDVADMDLKWVLDDTNIDAITDFAASSKSIVATMPSFPSTADAPHLSISSRMILNGLVNPDTCLISFSVGDQASAHDGLREQQRCAKALRAVGSTLLLKVREDFRDMISVGIKYRAYQRLLLATMVARGADSEKPLVSVNLPIYEDLCNMVRGHLDTMPAFCIADETFAWRLGDTLATAKRPRLS